MRPTLDERIKNRMRQERFKNNQLIMGLRKKSYYVTEAQDMYIKKYLAKNPINNED